MMIGVNVSSPTAFRLAEAFWDDGLIDYFELMLDNFLHVPPEQIAVRIDGRPVGIHIMSSMFLHRSRRELADIAGRMRMVLDVLSPMYVSDHLGIFRVEDHLLPDMVEVDYAAADRMIPLVEQWRDLLGVQLLLENFPSSDARGESQVTFYTELERGIGVRPLLDFSNAVVADLNGGAPAQSWLTAPVSISSCHISGYRTSDLDPTFVVDSHDQAVSDVSWRMLSDACAMGRAPATLTVERDVHNDLEGWRGDLVRVRNVAGAAR